MTVGFTVLIPARYASSRLPAKPLADIGGRPMVVRVAEQARASGARRVVVATDDARIRDAVTARGFDAVNLAGGMRAWASDGLPVVTDSGDEGRVI